MQKRAALARALVTDPTIVLFDEADHGSGPYQENSILSMIAHYRKVFGFTAVLISHDIPDVFFISDRILLLWEGKIAFQGPMGEYTRLNHPMIDDFSKASRGSRNELTGLLQKRCSSPDTNLTLDRGVLTPFSRPCSSASSSTSSANALGPQADIEAIKKLGSM